MTAGSANPYEAADYNQSNSGHR